MIQTVLLLPLLTGIFPFSVRHGAIVVIKFSILGLAANLFSCLLLSYYIIILGKSMTDAIRDQSPATDIKLVIRITNTIFHLIIISRRSIRFKREEEILNNILSKFQHIDEDWYRKYLQVVVIFAMELCEIIFEYGIFSYIRVSSETDMYIYDLTLFIRLSFEILTVFVVMAEYHLYRFFNNLIRFDVLKNSLSVHNLRGKFDDLYSLRMVINECYSLDLLLYFVTAQLLMLLECFDLVKLFSIEDNLKLVKMILGGVRITRLFALLSYIIWTWCAIGDESHKTIEYLLGYHMEKCSHQTAYQLELFLEDIETRNKLFSAHKLYDINMPFLYNICGTIFAYLILITTSSSSQQ